MRAENTKNTEKDNKISIIGIGRLGICAALVFEKYGYDVLGVDIMPSYVDNVNNKTLKSPEPSVEEYLKESTNFRATLSLDEAIEHSDLLFILVATPTGVGEKSYDHSMLSNVLCDINKRNPSNKHVIIGCTVLPGYIRNTGRFLLKNCINTTLNYNPEFIAQGEIIDGFQNPDMVLIGAQNKNIGDRLEQLYKNICQNEPTICRMSAESAEITKLSVNCFITTKIAFANTISDIAARTPGANDRDILNAIGSDSRIGNKCLRPGYGFGGPCFPRDNRALGNYSKSIGVSPIIPKATDKSNKLHANLMAEILIKHISRTPTKIYQFNDVAYKPGCAVPIIEESQKLAVARILVKNGYKVLISDRKQVIDEVIKEYGNLFSYHCTDASN